METATDTAADSSIFLVRQPILDRRKALYGYELLYRSNPKQNAYAHDDGDQASRRVMHGGLNVAGWSELVGPHLGFVNITRTLLVNEEYLSLPRETSVIELLETVEPDDEVISACKALKDAGYTLALDDFVFEPKYAPLVDLADILKIDFLAADAARREWFSETFGGGTLRLLAEKIESHADFEQAMNLGYTYFQGYFFCKPEVCAFNDIPAFKQNCLRFLKEVTAPQLDYARIEAVVKTDMSLSTKLLRYLNSSSMGISNRISSIKQALSMLGEKPLRKWATLVALMAMGKDKPSELMVTVLVRARFCELIATQLNQPELEMDLFMMGLFSALDALMDQPMSQLLSRIPLPTRVAEALLGSNNLLGRVYGLTLAIERGRGARIDQLSAELKLDPIQVMACYRRAVSWADRNSEVD